MANFVLLKYKLAPYGEAVLGHGAYGYVFKATEGGSNRSVALKKSRVSETLKRPTLQHEARILQLLEGHPAIPVVYGYGRLPHFEYMAMEHLGPSIAEKLQRDAAVSVRTVIRFMDQVLSALQHVHSIGVVHRDIKPENFLCAIDNPSIIKLIDFGISKPVSCNTPPQQQYDPLKERRNIVGTIYWASLNSHNGEGQHPLQSISIIVIYNDVDLSPRDDIESLALTALFLLRGNLPWKPRPHLEARLRSQEIVRIMKSKCSGTDLCADFPCEFGRLLDYSRRMGYNQLPDYEALRTPFLALSDHTGYSLSDVPLDWTPCYPRISNPTQEEPSVSIPDEDEDDRAAVEDREEGEDDLGEDSYFGFDIDIWDRQGERDKDLTLPAVQEAELDSTILLIGEVEGY